MVIECSTGEMCQCKEQNYATENKKNRGSEIEFLFLHRAISYLPSLLTLLQWNLNIMKGRGTGEICSQ